MNVELFGRSVAVTVGTARFTDIDAAFKIHKSNKPTPNTCELSIWNLNPEQRAKLEGIAAKGSAPAKTGIPCQIDAGYVDGLATIWLGDLRTAVTVEDGPDQITALSSGDGEKAWVHARLHVSYGPNTPVDTALRAIARSLGVGEGNLSRVVSQLRVGGSALWPTGKTLSGSSSRQLVQIARSAGLEVSIQDGALQFIDAGKTLAGVAVKLNQETGLIGAPVVDSEGILTCRTLMLPELRVGAEVLLESKSVNGSFKVLEGEWTGSTFGDDWFIDIQAEAL